MHSKAMLPVSKINDSLQIYREYMWPILGLFSNLMFRKSYIYMFANV